MLFNNTLLLLYKIYGHHIHYLKYIVYKQHPCSNFSLFVVVYEIIYHQHNYFWYYRPTITDPFTLMVIYYPLQKGGLGMWFLTIFVWSITQVFEAHLETSYMDRLHWGVQCIRIITLPFIILLVIALCYFSCLILVILVDGELVMDFARMKSDDKKKKKEKPAKEEAEVFYFLITL